jgi:hypothetical protein
MPGNRQYTDEKPRLAKPPGSIDSAQPAADGAIFPRR